MCAVLDSNYVADIRHDTLARYIASATPPGRQQRQHCRADDSALKAVFYTAAVLPQALLKEAPRQYQAQRQLAMPTC